jgi:outer membrane protein assembly factor BamD
MTRVLKSLFLLSVIILGVTACSSTKENDPDLLAQQQAQELYTRAKEALDNGNYSFAIDYYRALEASYPFGPLTEQGKLDLIYAYDKLGQRLNAVESADNFIQLYPAHQNIDYAYYMKGVANFTKKQSGLDTFIKGNQGQVRNLKALQDSMSAFEELLKRYPNSVYAADAKQRIIYLRNELAKKELSIASFYFDDGAYVAAVNRAKNVVYKYETTPAVEDALILLEKCYLKMGMTDLAKSTRAILAQNFPDYASTSNETDKPGFFKRLFKRD